MESLTCAQISVRAVHTKAGEAQTNLYKTRFGGIEEKKLSLTLPRQGIEPWVFGLEFRRSTHRATSPVTTVSLLPRPFLLLSIYLSFICVVLLNQKKTSINCRNCCTVRINSSCVRHFVFGDVVTGDVAQWLEGRNSNPKTLGSIPWRGRVRERVFSRPSESTLERFVCAWPPGLSCVRHAPKFVRTLKIPYPSFVKESASQPVAWKHENTADRGKKPPG